MSIITNTTPTRSRRPGRRDVTQRRSVRGRHRTVGPSQVDILADVANEATLGAISAAAAAVLRAPGATSVRRQPDPVMQERLASRYVRIVKPAIDRTAAVVVLTVVALPMLVIAAAVRLTMGSPVLFRQERVGLDGQPFTVLKFRTMHPDRRVARTSVPQDRRRTHKSAHDPRHTPVGRFLRKWSLDELPQFINVCRGEMSFIGPRPELPHVVESYTDHELHHRHLVRPGLTGLWQVSARGDGMMHENGGWDIDYVRQVSFTTDLKIVLKTPAAMLGDRTGE